MQKMSSVLKRLLIFGICFICLVSCGRNKPIAEKTVPDSIREDESTLSDGISEEIQAAQEETIESLEDEEPPLETSETDEMIDDVTSDSEEVTVSCDSCVPLAFDYDLIPEYSGEASIIINDNHTFLSNRDKKLIIQTQEYYSPVDELDRCGTVFMYVGTETMPADEEERGTIGMIKPSGWQTVKYPDLIEDLYLYNRCHLIGWQLGGGNANEYNLITGTRYLNISGMLQYENEVANYIKSTGNHVLYRVTPYFLNDELVARGVIIEAESVEDEDLSLCVWCYNVQPGIEIDYTTGESSILERVVSANEIIYDLILNTNTKKAHIPSCSSVSDMKEKNKEEFHGTLQELKERGYAACGRCHPF